MSTYFQFNRIKLRIIFAINILLCNFCMAGHELHDVDRSGKLKHTFDTKGNGRLFSFNGFVEKEKVIQNIQMLVDNRKSGKKSVNVENSKSLVKEGLTECKVLLLGREENMQFAYIATFKDESKYIKLPFIPKNVPGIEDNKEYTENVAWITIPLKDVFYDPINLRVDILKFNTYHQVLLCQHFNFPVQYSHDHHGFWEWWW